MKNYWIKEKSIWDFDIAIAQKLGWEILDSLQWEEIKKSICVIWNKAKEAKKPQLNNHIFEMVDDQKTDGWELDL